MRDLDAEAYVDAFAVSFAPMVGPNDARCMAQAVVAQLDVRALDEAGFSPPMVVDTPDLSLFGDALRPEAHEELARELAECNLGGHVMRALAAALGTSVDTIACVRASIEESEIGATYAATLLTGLEARDAGRQYGEKLVARLPGDCAHTIAITLLLEGETITEAEASCIEVNLTDELARLVIGPAGNRERALTGINALTQTCSSRRVGLF